MQTLKVRLSALVLAASAFVSAADASLPPMPANWWRGFYLGAQAGKAWNRTNWEYRNANYFNTLGSTVVGTNFNFSDNGFLGGINGGYNYQTGPIVLGLDATASTMSLEAQKPSPFFPTLDRYTSTAHGFVTAKARLGYALSMMLATISAGYAGGNASLTLNSPGAGVKASSRQWVNGWVAGAGADFRVTHNLALGLAFDYVRLSMNNQRIQCPNCSSGVGFGTPKVDSTLKTQVVTAKFTYLINQ